MVTASKTQSDENPYRDYHFWKGWDAPFTIRDLDRDRFRQDFVGISLRGRSLLEIGFGEGGLLAWARENGAIVSGCELTAESIVAAQQADIPLLPVDFETSPERFGKFDIIVAFDVFEHLDEDTLRAKFAAIDTMLSPGGSLVLRYPNGQSPFGLIAQHGDITHKVALSRSKVEQLAADTTLVTSRYTSAAFARQPRLQHRVVTALRGVVRRLIIKIIHQAFATDVPLEPVMLHVLTKPQGAWSNKTGSDCQHDVPA